MRGYFYDPKSNGFLHPAIHGEAACKGLKSISAEEYARLLAGQAQGKAIVAGKNKLPLLADRTDALDGSQLVALIKLKRNRLLKESDWTQLPDVPLSAEQRAAWATYRQALRDLSPGADWPTPPDSAPTAGEQA